MYLMYSHVSYISFRFQDTVNCMILVCLLKVTLGQRKRSKWKPYRPMTFHLSSKSKVKMEKNIWSIHFSELA